MHLWVFGLNSPHGCQDLRYVAAPDLWPQENDCISKYNVIISIDFQAECENEVNNELANRISLFYADATPMLKALSDGTTKFVSEVRMTVPKTVNT